MFKKVAMWIGWTLGWFTVGYFGTKGYIKLCDWFTKKVSE